MELETWDFACKFLFILQKINTSCYLRYQIFNLGPTVFEVKHFLIWPGIVVIAERRLKWWKIRMKVIVFNFIKSTTVLSILMERKIKNIFKTSFHFCEHGHLCINIFLKKLGICPNLPDHPAPLTNLGILNCYFLLVIWA